MYIEGKEIEKVLYEFPVLHSGWEMDNVGQVVDFTDGSSGLILTNHGRPYIGTIAGLEAKVKEYEKAIEETDKAMTRLMVEDSGVV